MQMEPKAIHDEMNSSTFDEFGRMQANLGIEAQPPTPGAQNVTLYPFVNPQTELIDGTNLPKQAVTWTRTGPVSDVKVTPISDAKDGTQIWRFTHNGVDTHPIHFHLYDVQVLNRVTWDNIIIPTDANELGWKDTVRMSPLEDTIVALRPIIPKVPFEVPELGAAAQPDDAGRLRLRCSTTSTRRATRSPRHHQRPVNFGWEYVCHCHILSHEEMDMMRPVSRWRCRRSSPTGLASSFDHGHGQQPQVVRLNAGTTTRSPRRRSSSSARPTGPPGRRRHTRPQPLGSGEHPRHPHLTDTTSNVTTAYRYRVVAENAVGYGRRMPERVGEVVVHRRYGVNAPAAPTSLTATLAGRPDRG